MSADQQTAATVSISIHIQASMPADKIDFIYDCMDKYFPATARRQSEETAHGQRSHDHQEHDSDDADQKAAAEAGAKAKA